MVGMSYDVVRLKPDTTTATYASCVVSGFSRTVGALLLVFVAACTSGPGAPEEGDYITQLKAFRDTKDRQFREEKDPVPAARKDKLLPLLYFPADESYVVPAQLKLADERPIVTMPTSTGTLRRYQRVGVLEFTLQNEKLTLGAFVEDGQPIVDLFVPF